jgi:hypothetical protein
MQPKDKFHVFISWSGSPANKIVLELKKLLEGILTINPSIVLFCSDTDISLGKTGRDVIEEELAKADFGILVLTENNMENAWLMYEAGAIAKHNSKSAQDSEGSRYTVIEKNRVCPILFARENINFIDSGSPIFEKQRMKYHDGKKGFKNLLLSIYEVRYDKLTEGLEKKLENELNVKWRKFSQKIDEILLKEDTAPLKKIGDLSNPGKLPKLMMDDEIYESILSKREDTLKALIGDLSNDSSCRIIFFGGISSTLRDEETIKKFAKWLIDNNASKMFFCHESKEVVEIRNKTLSEYAYDENKQKKLKKGEIEDAEKEKMENLEKRKKELVRRKIEEFEKMRNELLDKIGDKIKARVFFPEIIKPPTGYIIIAGTSFYYTPVWEKRGEKTFTFKLRYSDFCCDIIDYMSDNMINESSAGQKECLAELALIRKEIEQEHERQHNDDPEKRVR